MKNNNNQKHEISQRHRHRQPNCTRYAAAILALALAPLCAPSALAVSFDYTEVVALDDGTNSATIALAINPFGIPATGTGVLIQVDIGNPDPTILMQELLIESSGLVNIDAPNAATTGLLSDAPSARIQRGSDATLGNIFDAGATADFVIDDSYWANDMTGVILGEGIVGGDQSSTIMELRGCGHGDGIIPVDQFDMIYTVLTDDELHLVGELSWGAVGPILEFDIHWTGIPVTVPEPAAFGQMALAFGVLGFVANGRRRQRRNESSAAEEAKGHGTLGGGAMETDWARPRYVAGSDYSAT